MRERERESKGYRLREGLKVEGRIKIESVTCGWLKVYMQ